MLDGISPALGNHGSLVEDKRVWNLACVIREQRIPKGQSEERRWRSTFTPPYPNSPTPNGTTPTLHARSISSHRL
jgi:hypothetical protein